MLAIQIGPTPEQLVRLRRGQLMHDLVRAAWMYESENKGSWPRDDQWLSLLEAESRNSLAKLGPVYFVSTSRPSSDLWSGKVPAFFEDPSISSHNTVVAYWDGTFDFVSNQEFGRLVGPEKAIRIESALP